MSCSISLPYTIEKQLEALSIKTGRRKSFYVKLNPQ